MECRICARFLEIFVFDHRNYEENCIDNKSNKRHLYGLLFLKKVLTQNPNNYEKSISTSYISDGSHDYACH